MLLTRPVPEDTGRVIAELRGAPRCRAPFPRSLRVPIAPSRRDGSSRTLSCFAVGFRRRSTRKMPVSPNQQTTTETCTRTRSVPSTTTSHPRRDRGAAVSLARGGARAQPVSFSPLNGVAFTHPSRDRWGAPTAGRRDVMREPRSSHPDHCSEARDARATGARTAWVRSSRVSGSRRVTPRST